MFLKFYPGEDESATHFGTALESLSSSSSGQDEDEEAPGVSMALLQVWVTMRSRHFPLPCMVYMCKGVL